MTALRLPPFGSPSKFPRLSSLESTWEVESEIFGNEFSVSLVRGVLALTHFPALFHFNGHMFFDCTGCRIAHPASDRLVIECSPKSYAMHRGLVGVQLCIALIWFCLGQIAVVTDRRLGRLPPEPVAAWWMDDAI